MLVCILVTIAGTFMSGAAITFVLGPLCVPVISAVGLDPLVFGITWTILIEMALITPPVGVNLFVISGIVRDARLVQDIALGSLPFVVILILMIVILWIFPQLVLFIPSTMM